MTARALRPAGANGSPKNFAVWRLLWEGMRSSLSIWPDFAFDALYRSK